MTVAKTKSRFVVLALVGAFVGIIGSQVVRLTEPDHSWLNYMLLTIGCVGLVVSLVNARRPGLLRNKEHEE